MYLLVSPKETNTWPSICATNEKMNTQIKSGHFGMCVHVLGQKNPFFCKTNTQKTVAKVNNLCTEEKLSFVYLRIRVSGQRNHSLTPKNLHQKSWKFNCATDFATHLFWTKTANSLVFGGGTKGYLSTLNR